MFPLFRLNLNFSVFSFSLIWFVKSIDELRTILNGKNRNPKAVALSYKNNNNSNKNNNNNNFQLQHKIFFYDITCKNTVLKRLFWHDVLQIRNREALNQIQRHVICFLQQNILTYQGRNYFHFCSFKFQCSVILWMFV